MNGERGIFKDYGPSFEKYEQERRDELRTNEKKETVVSEQRPLTEEEKQIAETEGAKLDVLKKNEDEESKALFLEASNLVLHILS